MMVRGVIMDAPAAATTAIAAQQVGRDATFVEKNPASGINRVGEVPPLVPRRGDVGAISFGRAYRFF